MKGKTPIFSFLSVTLFTFAVQAAQMEGVLVPRSDHSPPKGFKHYVECPEEVVELDDAARMLLLKRVKDYPSTQEDLGQTALSMQRQPQLSRTSGGGILGCIRSIFCLGMLCLDGEEVCPPSKKPGDLPPPSRLPRLLAGDGTPPASGAVEGRLVRTSVRSPLKEKGKLEGNNDETFVTVADPSGWTSQYGIGLAMHHGELYMAYQGQGETYPRIYVGKSKDGCSWTEAASDFWQSTGGGISLASFQDTLCMAFSDIEEDKQIWVGKITDGRWRYNRARDWKAVGGVSLATFRGKLYMAYQGTGTPWYRIYVGESDNGVNWTSLGNINGWTAQWEIGLSAFQDKLYMAYQGTGSGGGIYVARSEDGREWNTVVHQSHWDASGGIGLTSFNNKLYMAYTGRGGEIEKRIYVGESDDGISWGSVSVPDWTGAWTIGLGTFSTPGEYTQSVEQLYMAYKGSGSHQQIYVAKYFSPIFLDVWGEGRQLSTTSDGTLVTGFFESSNLNKRGNVISPQPRNAGKPIPSLIPVENYDEPRKPAIHFPIGDNAVQYMTLMGAPIQGENTAKEMERVLNKRSSVVILYDLTGDSSFQSSKMRFEDASGLSSASPRPRLGYPFNEIGTEGVLPPYYVYFHGPHRSVVEL